MKMYASADMGTKIDLASVASYAAAIEYALDAWREAKSATNRAEQSRLYGVSLAQQDVIVAIYGVSEEKVMDDLDALLARDNELVYV